MIKTCILIEFCVKYDIFGACKANFQIILTLIELTYTNIMYIGISCEHENTDFRRQFWV